MAPEIPPADATFGKVVGKFLLAVGDTSADVDKLPDFVAATGTVRLTPTVKKLTYQSPIATVVPQTVVCTVSPDGTMLGPNGEPGVWLVAGVWQVYYSINNAPLDPHTIEVLTTHDDATPLQLTNSLPPGGPVLSASEYAELSARIDVLGSVPPGTVADATTNVKGIVQLAGDLGGVATAPTVPGLAGKMSRNPIVLTTEDLNSVLTSGIYFQPDPAQATGVRNYPMGAATLLFVFGDPTDGNPSVQMYTAAREWGIRTWDGATWTAWNAFSWSTHTHVSSQVSDFTEATQDIVGAMVAASGGTYNDTNGTITLPSVDSENVALGVQAYNFQTGKQVIDTTGLPTTTHTPTLTSSMLEIILTNPGTTRNQTINPSVAAPEAVVGRTVTVHIPANPYRFKWGTNVVVESQINDPFIEVWGTLIFEADNLWHFVSAARPPYLKGGSGTAFAFDENIDIFGWAEKMTSAAIQNVIIGKSACNDLTTGQYNIGIGNAANYSLTTGLYNVAVGISAGVLWNKTTISNTVAIGRNAAVAMDDGIAIGYNSDVNDTHTSSVALGAGTQTNAANQVAIGARDLEIQDAAKGVVLKSPNGTRYRVTVSDAGALVVTAA